MTVQGIRHCLRVLSCVFFALLCVTASQNISAQVVTQLQPPSHSPLPPPPPGVNPVLDSARAIRGLPLRLSLITYGPTYVLWERFGHDAIAVRDTVTGQSAAYNWGEFDFRQPRFLWRFLTGETKYWMEAFPTTDFNETYYRDNRTVREQQLALTPVERAALMEFLAWNSTEENKFYRYDYYRDNCATRARDALDYVLTGRLKTAIDTGSHGRTWRSETARVTASDPLVYSGIEIALGRHADELLTPWAESFMPERFANAIETLVLRNNEGQRYKLVLHDSVLFASTRVPMPTDPPERVSMAALLGLTLAGIIAFLADSRFRFSHGVLVTFVSLWYIVGGILGTALFLAGTVTKHAPYMGSNNTLWQINPVLLVGAFIVPRALARQQTSALARIVSTFVLALSLIGVLLQLIPSLAQHNGVVVAVTFPVHFAIAIALWRMSAIEGPRRVPAAAAQRAA